MLVATYPTKRDLRASIGQPLRYEETSLFGPEYKADGTFPVVGPGAYERKWYAQVTVENGVIVAVDGRGSRVIAQPKPLTLGAVLASKKPLRPFKSCCKVAAMFNVVCRDCNPSYKPFSRLGG